VPLKDTVPDAGPFVKVMDGKRCARQRATHRSAIRLVSGILSMLSVPAVIAPGTLKALIAIFNIFLYKIACFLLAAGVTQAESLFNGILSDFSLTIGAQNI